MIFYLTIAAIAITMAAIVKPLPTSGHQSPMSRRQLLNATALLFIFSLLFIVQSLRLNVGNDYIRYVELMHFINVGAYVPTEPGFNALVRLVYGLSGFNNYLTVFAIISGATLFLFIHTLHRESEHFLFSFFLFMSFGYYFQSFSSVRYYLALALAFFAIPFLLKKQWLSFVALILLAALFHVSILVVLPLYFLAALDWKKWMLALGGLFCVSFLFLQDFYLRIMLFLYPNYQDTEFLDTDVQIVNIIRCAAVLVFSLLYYKDAVRGHVKNRFYFYCNLGALILYTLCSFIPVVSRIAYYLTITHMLFLPAIVRRIEDRRWRLFFTGAIILAGVLYLVMYLILAQDNGVRLYPYQTFLFHELPKIWSVDF